HGISLRKTRSAKPRKTITIASETIRAFQKLQPLCCVNQTISAGAVITATSVATRVRRRQDRASSRDASPEGNDVSGAAVVIDEVYAGLEPLDVQRPLTDRAPASVASMRQATLHT